MICKERDKREHTDNDKFSQAGAKAEEQMAFYLRRAFADEPEAWVFHDLRFEDGAGDAVQIDHLVLHPYGMILIESKSVTSEVRVNKHLEWTRVWQGREMGMPSPIQQAKLQAENLKKILNLAAEELRGKLLGKFQKGFNACPFEIIVGISDSGIIRRDVDLPEVCKADQVAERISAIVQRHKKATSLLSLSLKDGMEHFGETERQKISEFFIARHRSRQNPSRPSATKAVEAASPPVVREVTTSNVPPPASPATGSPQAMAGSVMGICQKCGKQCEILWGKYGYYWKCAQCQSNMPIKEYCPTCKGKLRLRKDQSRFYKYCEPCKSAESLYWEASN